MLYIRATHARQGLANKKKKTNNIIFIHSGAPSRDNGVLHSSFSCYNTINAAFYIVSIILVMDAIVQIIRDFITDDSTNLQICINHDSTKSTISCYKNRSIIVDIPYEIENNVLPFI